MAPPLHIAQEILAKAHDPETALAIFTEKVLHKPLHLQPASQDPNAPDARVRRRLVRVRKEEKVKRRQKVKPFSAKEKRISGVYDIPQDKQRYDIYQPLHQMWLEYMREILGIELGKATYISAQSKGSVLASADYHGARLMVVRARCSSLVGLEGIVVKDTKFTMQIITEQNQLKIIPKKHAVLRFEIPQATFSTDEAQKASLEESSAQSGLLAPLTFEIHGSQFETRATDRSTKKFKHRYLKDI